MIAVSSLFRCFADDLVGSCDRCHRPVYYRPHTTTEVPIDERVCTACYEKVASPDDEHVTSMDSVREFLLWVATHGKKPQ